MSEQRDGLSAEERDEHIIWALKILRTYGVEEYRCAAIAECLIDEGLLAEPVVARRESEAAEKALRDAARSTTRGPGWGPAGFDFPACVMTAKWLRARADSVAQGREETP